MCECVWHMNIKIAPVFFFVAVAFSIESISYVCECVSRVQPAYIGICVLACICLWLYTGSLHNWPVLTHSTTKHTYTDTDTSIQSYHDFCWIISLLIITTDTLALVMWLETNVRIFFYVCIFYEFSSMFSVSSSTEWVTVCERICVRHLFSGPTRNVASDLARSARADYANDYISIEWWVLWKSV